MKAIQIVALVSVIGFSMGAKHSLKQKLAERGNILAQVESTAQNGLDASCPDCNSSCPVLNNTCPGDLDAEDCNCTPGEVGLNILLGSGDFTPTSVQTVLSSNSE